MADVTVLYDAKRSLVNNLGEDITISFRSDFSKTPDVASSTIQSMDGSVQQTTLDYFRYVKTYSTAVIDEADYPTFVEFLSSVSGGEVFAISDPEENDRMMFVKLHGKFSQSRATDVRFNTFRFTFSCIEQV
jgi:hypothetical protein